MTVSIVIMQLAILAVVLESDLGRRKIGWFRVGRPIVTVAVIVPFFFDAVPTGRNDLLLQGAGVLVGAGLGLFSVCPLLVSVAYDPDWRPRWPRRYRSRPGRPAAVSHAGIGYAAIWIAVTVARLGFAYGSEHVFPVWLGTFLYTHQLAAASLTDGFIFLSVSMSLARSLGLRVRAQARIREATRAPRHGAALPVSGGAR